MGSIGFAMKTGTITVKDGRTFRAKFTTDPWEIKKVLPPYWCFDAEVGLYILIPPELIGYWYPHNVVEFVED